MDSVPATTWAEQGRADCLQQQLTPSVSLKDVQLTPGCRARDPVLQNLRFQFTHMSEPVITIEENAPEEDIRALWNGLGQFNFSQTGLGAQLISTFLRNEQREVIGGAHGWTAYGWLHIRAFWLREDQRRRGWGSSLLQATEAEAVKRGCRYSHLETFSFQSLGFYQKNGYRVFGELGNVAGDHRWYFLEKNLC